MTFILIVFICFVLLLYYVFWFLPEGDDGKMLSIFERIIVSFILSPFLALGVGGLYYHLTPKRYSPPEPIEQVVHSIIKWYDANKNGQIELKREVRVIHCESSTTCNTYSHGALFIAANQNKDSVVTALELTNLLMTFDTEDNNALDWKTEMQNLHKKYPEHKSNGFRRESLYFKTEPLVE